MVLQNKISSTNLRPTTLSDLSLSLVQANKWDRDHLNAKGLDGNSQRQEKGTDQEKASSSVLGKVVWGGGLFVVVVWGE